MLEILKYLFENEDRIYPQKRGFKGRWMLVQAILDLAAGKDMDYICKEYKLPNNSDTIIHDHKT